MNAILPPAMAAKELVDNFNGTAIDFSKWSGLDPADNISEYFVGVSVDDKNLVLINAGDGSSLLIDQGSRTWVRVPDVSAIQANISVVSVEDGGGKAAANLEGQYYNANSAVPANQTGDVAAILSIGDRGKGFLEAWSEILVSTHPSFETWTKVTEDVVTIPGALNPNTAYTAKIEYNDVTNIFTFIAGGTNIQRSGPPRKGLPYFTRQNLSVTTCCGTNPIIHATFDDVWIGNEPLDSFSSGPYLERSKWGNHSGAVVLSSRVNPAVKDKLFMFVADENILRNGESASELVLRERNPYRIEAQVSISSNSVLESGLRGRARLNGYVYNERRDGGINALPYFGCDGDVWVEVEINLKNDVLYATAFSGSETSGCDTDKALISETFTKLLAFDTEYLLWIERDGKNLVLGLDDEEYRHTITTPIYSPSPTANNGFRRLSAGIEGTPTSDLAGGDGVFEILVDNVYVEGPDEGDGGDCFIATAAYGSYLDPHVRTLRKFRDNNLLTNSIGTWFVEFYYRHSPPLADYIRKRETLRELIRSGLAVVVYSIKYPTAAGLVLLLPVLILIRQRRRRLGTISNLSSK
jgi:hypothetical protein